MKTLTIEYDLPDGFKPTSLTIECVNNDGAVHYVDGQEQPEKVCRWEMIGSTNMGNPGCNKTPFAQVQQSNYCPFCGGKIERS